jgi:hypothetical protein
MLHKHVTATLPYVHKSQLETQCILAVLATRTWHAAQPPHTRLQQMGSLSPLSWVKMSWILLHYFNIHLHMESQPILLPRERDQVVMKILFGKNLNTNRIRSLSQCRGTLEIIFLSDMMIAIGRYLE